VCSFICAAQKSPANCAKEPNTRRNRALYIHSYKRATKGWECVFTSETLHTCTHTHTYATHTRMCVYVCVCVCVEICVCLEPTAIWLFHPAHPSVSLFCVCIQTQQCDHFVPPHLIVGGYVEMSVKFFVGLSLSRSLSRYIYIYTHL